ncbi:hypothetical protein NUW58_g9815 [Xylaria curta]|uniref:Uncharacterized protein n=1 Tax=Xylaria curta TaxID=42375 RepID=A0ACC1MUK4_9PEZI|nr:hypothetical protein NUW58_g9815 [Xylaria curta]
MGSSDLLSQIPGLTLVESQPANAQEALTETHSAVDSYECSVAPAAVHGRDDNKNSSLAAEQSLATVAEPVAQAASKKRSSSEIDDGDADTDAERPTKKMKIEDES